MDQVLTVAIVVEEDTDFDGNPIQLKEATPSLDGVVVGGLLYSFPVTESDATIIQEVRTDLVARGYSLVPAA